MGNAQSQTSKNLRSERARRAFSKKELENLHALFVSLSSQSQSPSKGISLSVLQSYFNIHGPLADWLLDLLTQNRCDSMIIYDDLHITKATYKKETAGEIEELIYQLCDVTGDGVLSRFDLEGVLVSIHDAVFSMGDIRSGSSFDRVSCKCSSMRQPFQSKGKERKTVCILVCAFAISEESPGKFVDTF